MRSLACPMVVTALLSLFALPGQQLARSAEELADELLSMDSLVANEVPQWSRDGSRILFASGLGGRMGLWSIGPDGGFPVRLVQDVGGVNFLASHMPQWSPMDDWISYVSDRSGSSEIWLWSTQDARHRQLSNLGARISSYSWSPDGKWIAFAGDRHGNFDVWKIEVPTGRVERLTKSPNYEISPSWTQDGKAIVYARLDDTWSNHEVIAVALDGTQERVIARDTDFFNYGASTRSKFGPILAPHGRTLLFRSHRSGWINYWSVPLSGGEPQPLAADNADQSDASWSPDGKRVAYVTNRNGTHELRIIPVGGVPRVLVRPRMGVVADPQWSPDGSRIAFTLTTPEQPKDLFIVSVEGGPVEQLTISTPGGIDKRALIIPEKVHYQSGDGFTIPAYL